MLFQRPTTRSANMSLGPELYCFHRQSIIHHPFHAGCPLPPIFLCILHYVSYTKLLSVSCGLFMHVQQFSEETHLLCLQSLLVLLFQNSHFISKQQARFCCFCEILIEHTILLPKFLWIDIFILINI